MPNMLTILPLAGAGFTGNKKTGHAGQSFLKLIFSGHDLLPEVSNREFLGVAGRDHLGYLWGSVSGGILAWLLLSKKIRLEQDIKREHITTGVKYLQFPLYVIFDNCKPVADRFFTQGTSPGYFRYREVMGGIKVVD